MLSPGCYSSRPQEQKTSSRSLRKPHGGEQEAGSPQRLCARRPGHSVSPPWPSLPYCLFSCSGGGFSTRMLQWMSGMGSASSRDTHNTDCSFPAGGRKPTFCQGEGNVSQVVRVPPCLLLKAGGRQFLLSWASYLPPEDTAWVTTGSCYIPNTHSHI